MVSFAGLWLDLPQCISAFPTECWPHNLSEIDPTDNSKAEFCGFFSPPIELLVWGGHIISG